MRILRPKPIVETQPVKKAPKKRVDKTLVQRIVSLTANSEVSGETSMLVEALAEIKDDETTKSAVWSQLTTSQQEFIRITKEM